MDAEGLFFSAVCKTGDVSHLRGLNRDHLVEPYDQVYDYVVEFVRAQGKLPRHETVDARFPRLLPRDAPEDPSFYADAIRENAMRVDIEDGIEARVLPHLADQRASSALGEARSMVSEVSERYRTWGQGAVLNDISANVEARMADYRLRKAAQGAIGLPTPWRTLTLATGGLQNTDACALLARPNMGKTWALVLWAVYLWQKRFKVLFVSMESPPEGRKPKDRSHRVVGPTCLRCYQHGVSERDECPAADIPRQRLSIRFDALGSRLSAWRLYKGWLTPQEEATLERYYRACATKNNGKWGDLKIVATPYIKTLGDLEMEILQYEPDVVFWDSAYLAAQPQRNRGENRWGALVHSFKLMLERVQIPGVVSWHFNRDVAEKATEAGMGAGALTDELPRVFDTILGMFRPPEVEEAGECIWRGLKTRDGVRMGTLRTNFQVKDCIDFSEIGEGV